MRGEPGIGKTHFLERIASDLRDEGWFPLDVAAHEIQRNTPFMLANRLIGAALAGLGSEADRYTSGLEEGLAALDRSFARRFGLEAPVTLDSTRYRDVFARFFEGVGADRKIAILCDDAQWIDPQSAQTLEHLAATYLAGPLAIVYAERIAASDADVRRDGALVLEPLAPGDALPLVRARFPALSEVLAQTVVDHAGGNPFELVTLAEEAAHGDAGDDAAEKSARELIAARVRRLGRDDREFLQFCALLGEPIEYRVLFARYDDPERVARLVGNVGRPYFVADGPALRFRHARVAEAVRSTIAIDVPLRRQIVEVLQGLTERDLTDYERIATQALAMDDKTLAFDAYVAAAELAMSRRGWDAAASAFDRATTIGSPKRRDLVRFAIGYAWALRSVNRDPEAVELLQSVLSEFRDGASVAALGSVVALLASALWALEKVAACNDVLDSWLPNLPTGERPEVAAIGLFIAATCWDQERVARYRQHLPSRASMSPSVRALADAAESIEASGRGDYQTARQRMDECLARLAESPGRRSDLLPFTSLLIEYRHSGVRRVSQQLPELLRRTRLGNQNLFSGIFFRACVQLAAGDWEDAGASIAEAAEIREVISVSAPMFALPALMAALSGDRGRWAPRIKHATEEALRARCSDTLLQLGPWSALALEERIPELEDLLGGVVVGKGMTPRFIALAFFPFGFALWSHARGRADLLERLATASRHVDASPWARAHDALMRGVALNLSGRRAEAATELDTAARAFSVLQSPFFAAYAAHTAGIDDDAGRRLLEKLGVSGIATGDGRRPKRPRGTAGLTPREREVAGLVAQGMTNRQAATQLFLSERTIEIHLGNVYAKLGVGSRAMLLRQLWSQGDPAAALARA